MLAAAASAGDRAAAAACSTTKFRSLCVAGLAGVAVAVIALGVAGSAAGLTTPDSALKGAPLAGAVCALVALAAVCAWNVAKYRMVDGACSFTFPRELGCAPYQAAWQRGFANSKIATFAANTQALATALEDSSSAALSSIGAAADSAAGVTRSIAGFRKLRDDWDAHYELSKCAVGHAMTKRAFVAMRLAMRALPIAVLGGAFYLALHARVAASLRRGKASSPSGVAAALCAGGGALVGAGIGALLCTVQTGRWRRALGLPFIDWPRLVL